MSTYFLGNSEIPGGGGDGLQTLILMNPAYAGYSDNQPTTTAATPHNNNFVFLNSNSPANNGHNLHHAPPQQFVGIPLHGASAASPRESHHHHEQQQDVPALHGFLPQQQRLHYNFYNMPIDLAAARDVPRAQQGLSLSLSSQQQQPQLGYGSFRQEREVPSHQQSMVAGVSPSRVGGGDEVRGSPSSASGVSNGVTGVQSVLMSSKYLKAAQELLDEVVNVGKGSNKISGGAESSKGANGQTKNAGDSSPAAATNGDGSSSKRVADLTTPERQEIQMKKAKLVNMLDEVEQRYRQYHHQMQIVITWFEQAAGIGSARTYTALALQTISKQFRCLKDAILCQIRSASRSLGEEDYIEGKPEGSRLKYVDNQIRQQRALQQLGMIQQNAWRPQRGLPERSVSVLRAWLFENFLHPYPKDSDKLMLAKQTGLTRSQVSNWFINARVRLWKPMVEEMYMEEMKEHEKNRGSEDQHKDDDEDSPSKSTTRQPNSNSPGGVPDNRRQNSTSKFHDSNPMMIHNPPTMSISPTSTSPTGLPIIRNVTGFNLIGSSSDIATMGQQSPKKLRSDILRSSMDFKSEDDDSNNNNNIQLKFAGERQGRDGGFTLMGAPTNFIGAFGSYPIPELTRFGAEQFPAGPYSGNGVSLTLGLPHCESISMQGAAHQSFIQNQQTMQLGRGVEIGETNNFAGMNTQNSGNVYENINIQNRKRYAAQLLPDFVA